MQRALNGSLSLIECCLRKSTLTPKLLPRDSSKRESGGGSGTERMRGAPDSERGGGGGGGGVGEDKQQRETSVFLPWFISERIMR